MRRNIALVAALLAATVPALAAAQTVTFSTNQTSFTFPATYQGSTRVGGVLYRAGETRDLTVLPSGVTYGTPRDYADAAADPDVRWTFYRQPYSVVIGNMKQTSGGNYWYVRDVVGQNTPLAALPSSGSYTYNGKTSWHDLDREGDFTYTVNLATRTGSGSITNMQGGSAAGTPWVGTGTLSSAPIALQADGTVGVKNGSGTLTTNNAWINFVWAISGVNPKYDLALYGPNAQEVAGAVRLSSAIGSFGIAGTR